MKSFLKEEYDEEDFLINEYHDAIAELIDELTNYIEVLPEKVADLVFEVNEIAEELLGETTVAGDVGDYKPPLKKKKDELDEAKKKVKRDKLARLERRKEYKRNKSKIKSASKRLRKTSAYKKYKKKAKRMNKRGKTASGKRQTTFI